MFDGEQNLTCYRPHFCPISSKMGSFLPFQSDSSVHTHGIRHVSVVPSRSDGHRFVNDYTGPGRLTYSGLHPRGKPRCGRSEETGPGEIARPADGWFHHRWRAAPRWSELSGSGELPADVGQSPAAEKRLGRVTKNLARRCCRIPGARYHHGS